jgi:hypothetical protein
MNPLRLLFLAGLFALGIPAAASAQSPAARFEDLDRRVQQLERQQQGARRGLGGLSTIAFVAAVVSALWAQNTGRNAWLWFFLGLLFSVITLLVLLYKNAHDVRTRRGAA